MTYSFNSKKFKQGQALLLVVMLLATVITVVMTVAFKTSTDTQVTKLEQESQKGLAAAEVGIEQALATKAVSGSVPINTGDFTGTASITTQAPGTQFSTPLLQKDQEYTFYLARFNPDPALTEHFSFPYTSVLNIYYSTEGTSCDALPIELTLIYGNTGSVTSRRYIIDKGRLFGPSTNGGNLDGISLGSPKVFNDGISYSCQAQASLDLSTTNFARLLIVRPFDYGTRVGFESAVAGGTQSVIPPQGKTITSQAQSRTGGTTKRVQLFQSFPQIPTDFFVTQF